MNRREFLRGVGLGAAAACAAPFGAHAEERPDRPNILFIFSDDYGIGGVGCYGAQYATPCLDALAKTGTRFTHCFSAPLCAPARALCMSGRYSFRTGVVDNGTGARLTPQNATIIAKVLKQAGYATAVAGKWRQLSHFTTAEDAKAWGFDEFLIWGVGGRGERYWDPDYNLNSKPLENPKGKYGPDLLHDFVVDFIARHKDRPFFVYYPMPLVHGPILRTPDSAPNSKSLFADNIAYMDKLVGKLVAELDRLGLREKTLVVFTGDNGNVGGGSIGGRPIDGGKGSMKEGGSRVPLIANWKGTTPAGQVLKDLVDFTDFYPTFAELGGAKLPEGEVVDGRSFAAQLRGQPGQPREWVYIQLGGRYYARSARWKLNESGQLFDMKDAPFREIPVAADDADPEAAAARKALQAALDTLGVAGKVPPLNDQGEPGKGKQRREKGRGKAKEKNQ
ncbi:MAG TPA: sulfatase-like hydrolase/transferase [Planctomycetota bacterium]|nr:sulfatase-like hydrolase/transferase [Planctomycetota bacterium]